MKDMKSHKGAVGMGGRMAAGAGGPTMAGYKSAPAKAKKKAKNKGKPDMGALAAYRY